MRLRLMLAVFAGGALGGLARSALERARPWDGHGWPWVTFAVNLGGTAILAAAVTLLAATTPRSIVARAVVGPGLCGALTTFSTLQLEALELVHAGDAALAAAYLAVTVAAGLATARVVGAALGART
jgi:CrcB protein